MSEYHDRIYKSVDQLENIPQWKGPSVECSWCNNSLADVCIDNEPVCATCHVIAYERALIRDRYVQRDRANNAIEECEKLKAEVERLQGIIQEAQQLVEKFSPNYDGDKQPCCYFIRGSGKKPGIDSPCDVCSLRGLRKKLRNVFKGGDK